MIFCWVQVLCALCVVLTTRTAPHSRVGRGTSTKCSPQSAASIVDAIFFALSRVPTNAWFSATTKCLRVLVGWWCLVCTSRGYDFRLPGSGVAHFPRQGTIRSPPSHAYHNTDAPLAQTTAPPPTLGSLVSACRETRGARAHANAESNERGQHVMDKLRKERRHLTPSTKNKLKPPDTATAVRYQILGKSQRSSRESRSPPPPGAAVAVPPHDDWVTVTSSGRSPALPPMCSTSMVPFFPASTDSGVFGATLTAEFRRWFDHC